MTPNPPSSSKTRRRSDGVVEPSTALVLDSKQMNAKQRDETFDYFCNAVLGVDRQTFLEQTLFHTDELPPVSKKPTKPIMEKGSLYFRKERTATVVVEHWDKSQPCMLGLSTVLVPPAVIDTVNISNASLEGMAQVVGQLAEAMNTRIKSKKGLFAGAEPLTRENTVVLVDGKCLPWCFLPSKEREKILVDANKEKETKRRHVCRQRIGNDYATSEFAQFPCYAIVKGDSLYYSIAASSVCSKVIRDTFVEEVLDKQFPLYRFAEHKGYCTELHNSTLKKYGIVKEVHRLSYDPVRQLLNE
ncbi:ribonuclease HII [Angomonas deanei]|uniref:Ribonuclease n=1 Tax=Angomonas deanei TaxID=59799 RepID=A0A7G2C0E3_9TRYP|nr:ribonuclease HII [Angomonas deanei]CAD2212995.1 Ribonuclease HII, putative [Angomonas deanei]|eukprot:EPY27668.1 ribonuclease HII [Angomonas deanei]